MATLLDPSPLASLTPIFVLVFIFTIVYALMAKTKFLGNNQAFNAIVAMVLALLFIIVPEANTILTFFTPWLLVLGLVIGFIFVFFMALGVKEGDIVGVAKDSVFITTIIIAVLIVFLIAVFKAFGPVFAVNQSPGFFNSLKRVVFHPRILGVFIILLIAMYTMRFIAGERK